MKHILLFSIIITTSAFAKPTVVNFNQVLNEEVQTEIKKDDERFKKDHNRSPASVESTRESSQIIEEVPKLDKNVRQIGPNKW